MLFSIVKFKKKGKDVFPLDIPYSTKETRIGTWTNGKPLYRKVIFGVTNATVSNSLFIPLINNIDYFKVENCNIDGARPYYFYLLENRNTLALDLLKYGKNFCYRVLGESVANKSFELEITYTKTTE